MLIYILLAISYRLSLCGAMVCYAVVQLALNVSYARKKTFVDFSTSSRVQQPQCMKVTGRQEETEPKPKPEEPKIEQRNKKKLTWFFFHPLFFFGSTLKIAIQSVSRSKTKNKPSNFWVFFSTELLLAKTKNYLTIEKGVPAPFLHPISSPKTKNSNKQQTQAQTQ